MLPFVFYLMQKDIIYRMNDKGKENFKANDPCLVAEKDNSEIRSYVYQS